VRGAGLGRKAAWVGPGHVLAMEGSVVWIKMFGELRRASVEQTQEATTNGCMDVGMVWEHSDVTAERAIVMLQQTDLMMKKTQKMR